ncbi:hypothetical protein [uncultured Desulfovibrio sp.]|jgi:hypothetical protein|nr:hypothetical protein [uncultured Desulfovibrio sp.]
MLKRLADWLEKLSVAALAVGLFQGKTAAVAVGVLALLGCLWLTKKRG